MKKISWLIFIIIVLLLTGCNNAANPTVTLEASATEAAPTQITVTPTLMSAFTPEPSPTSIPLLDLPSGQYLVYSKLNDDTVGNESYAYYAINPKGGTPILIIDGVEKAAVSPDSLNLAYIRDSWINYYSPQKDSKDKVFTKFPLPDGTSVCELPVWSPDSKKFLVNCGGPFEPRITILVEKGIAQELKWADGKLCDSYSWSPDGQSLAAECSEADQTGTTVRIFSDIVKKGRVVLGCEGDVLCNRPSWSPTGDLILFYKGSGRSGPSSLDDGYYVTKSNCIGSNSICTHAASNPVVGGEWAAWSPSGTEFAFVDAPSIIAVDLVSNKSRVVRTLESPSGLLWSPDGEMLVYSDNTFLFSLSLKNYESIILDKGNSIIPSGFITRLP